MTTKKIDEFIAEEVSTTYTANRVMVRTSDGPIIICFTYVPVQETIRFVTNSKTTGRLTQDALNRLEDYLLKSIKYFTPSK